MYENELVLKTAPKIAGTASTLGTVVTVVEVMVEVVAVVVVDDVIVVVVVLVCVVVVRVVKVVQASTILSKNLYRLSPNVVLVSAPADAVAEERMQSAFLYAYALHADTFRQASLHSTLDPPRFPPSSRNAEWTLPTMPGPKLSGLQPAGGVTGAGVMGAGAPVDAMLAPRVVGWSSVVVTSVVVVVAVLLVVAVAVVDVGTVRVVVVVAVVVVAAGVAVVAGTVVSMLAHS